MGPVSEFLIMAVVSNEGPSQCTHSRDYGLASRSGKGALETQNRVSQP